MERDHYQTLGVRRDASQAEIQQAYRTLAKKYHPDLNPNDKTAQKKFQEVQAAFDVLGDPKKREQYDRYGSAFEHMGQAGAGAYGGAGHGFEEVDLSQFFGERFGGGFTGGFGGGAFADIFEQLRQASETPRRKRRAQSFAESGGGQDISQTIEVPFRSAVTGDTIQLSLKRPSGKLETLAVKIPVGIEDGKKIRLRGQGEPDPYGGPPGDILLIVRVTPHPFFTRRGKDLYVTVPVTVGEAALGAKVDVPSPNGPLSIRVPPGSTTGTRLRVRGQGIAPPGEAPGDLYAQLEVQLPKRLDEASQRLVRELEERNPMNPRAELRW